MQRRPAWPFILAGAQRFERFTPSKASSQALLRAIAFILALLTLTLAVTLAHVQPAVAQGVAASVTTDRIDINTRFQGATVTIFGGYRESGIGAGLEGADIVIVTRAGGRPVNVRERKRQFGLWLQGEPVRVENVPGFVHIASNRPLSEIADEATLRRFQLSLQSLRFDVGIADPNRQFAVKAAILRSRRREGLFAQDQNGVRIIDDTIFDTEVAIPAAAPVGRYEVEVFVFRDGDLEDLSLDRFILARAGLEQFVHDFALGRPTLYGLTALALALTAGWIASLFFRKR